MDKFPDCITHAYVMLTEECPCRCEYCWVKDRANHLTITEDKIEALVNRFSGNTKPLLIFFGGEPLLKQDLICKCPDGHIYTTRWNRFQQGMRCPICNSPKGEDFIIKLLEELGIKFIHDESIWKPYNNLRPDFFLPNYNLVIEFDGIQHFEPIEFFGGQKGFEKRKQKDREKNEYCKNNNIDILRIPYWDFDNIEKIIKNKLKIN